MRLWRELDAPGPAPGLNEQKQPRCDGPKYRPGRLPLLRGYGRNREAEHGCSVEGTVDVFGESHGVRMSWRKTRKVKMRKRKRKGDEGDDDDTITATGLPRIS